MIKNVKKSVPILRFPEFTGDWERTTLSKITDPVKRTLDSGEAPVLTISSGNGFVDQKERFNKVIAGSSLVPIVSILPTILNN